MTDAVRDADGISRELEALRTRVEELSRVAADLEQAQASARSSEKRYRVLFEQAPDSIVLLDPETGRVLDFNTPAHENLGYTRAEFADLSLDEIDALESSEEIRRHLARVRADRTDIFETKQRTRDGRLRAVLIHARLVSVGGTDLVQGVWRDVTDQNRAERVLHSQRELATALSATTSLHEGLALCLRAALQVSGMDCGGIHLRDEASGALQLELQEGLSSDFVAAVSHNDPDSANTRLVMAGRPVYGRYEQLRCPLDRSASQDGLRAVAVIPLRHEDRVIGCMNLASRVFDEVPAFSRVALETIAAQVGSAIARLRVAEALRVERERFYSLLEGLPALVALQSADYSIRYANRRFRERFGEPAERPCYEIMNGRSEPCEVCKTLPVLAGSQPQTWEWNDAHSGHATQIYAYPFTDVDGSSQVLVLGIDITQRQRAEAALRESEAKWKAVSRSVPDHIMLLDRSAKILFINRTVPDLSEQEVIGKSMLDFLPPSFQRVASECVERAWETGSTASFSVDYETKSGDIRHFESRVGPVVQSGEVVALVVISVDVTERKRAEQELTRHREHLEELVEDRSRELQQSRESLMLAERLASVGTLAAGLAHQINNPLASILASVEYALICEGDSGAQEIWRRALEDAAQQTRRCGRIVRNILRFAREEATEKWRNDVNEVVRRACDVTARYASQRGAVVEFEPCPGSNRVWMNPMEMEQALVNLIHNAIESRQADAQVKVRNRCRSGMVHIEVRDNGRGVGQEVLKRIFDPFYTTRLAEGGTGLGLSVAHGIVVDHGGQLKLDSEPGRGTTATVELPLCRDSDDREGPLVGSES